MSSSGRAALILAGGAGTRLWPLSTDDNPKQFLQIFGGRSLLQMTWERLRRTVEAESLYIATNERYLDKATEQLPELRPGNALLEPARRNTAPAIATCCAGIARREPGVTIGVFPSDHSVADAEAFAATIGHAFDFASRGDALVTIGIRPTEPNTGFGYLEMGPSIGPGVVRVEQFVEKPDLARARQMVASGRFAWNGGMFVWRSDAFEAALAATAPEVASLSREIAASVDAARRRELYERMPSVSIDYAVMEKAAGVAALWGDFGWSDVGSWSAVARLTGGSGRSDVFEEAASNNYVLGAEGKPVAIVGVEGVAVIDSPDGLLVLSLDEAEALSRLVPKITGK